MSGNLAKRAKLSSDECKSESSKNPPKEQIIKLISSDGKEFEVPINVIRRSGTINKSIEDLKSEGKKEDQFVISVQNVTGPILELVIRYCEEHREDPISAEDEENEEVIVSRNDSELLNVLNETLYDVMLAADYLNVKGLLDVACQIIANMVKGKTVEQMRYIYNIENDFSPEEEEQIRRENAWCEIQEPDQ